MKKYFVVLLFLITVGCFKKDATPQKSLLATLLSVNETFVQVYSIDPERVYPEITADTGVYQPSKVTIYGKGFVPDLTSNTVKINDTQVTVDYATTDKIMFTVPKGIKSGLLSVSKNGGSCNSLDKKSGTNCSATDIFVDCYKAYKNSYGAETMISFNSEQTFKFAANETKAFRVNLPKGNSVLNIECIKTILTVRVFSPSCENINQTVNNTMFLYNPTFELNSEYTMQFFVTGSSGDCKIRAYKKIE